jgi:hypothetical protein
MCLSAAARDLEVTLSSGKKINHNNDKECKNHLQRDVSSREKSY